MRNEIAQIDKRLEKLGQERAAAETALSTGSASPIEIADLGRPRGSEALPRGEP
jgi:ATP-binding cassette subfamily F protein 3